MSKTSHFDYFSMSSSENNVKTNKFTDEATSPNKLETETHNDSDDEEFPIFYGRRASSHGAIKKDCKNGSSTATDIVIILYSDDEL